MERESSRDRDSGARHQHSFSFSDSASGRSSVPMWDSSDPDRAPPPLPLAPNHGSPTTKANTSAGIAAAARQIVERARESAPISSYTSNLRRDSDALPERSLVKGAHHKRMQSLQPGNVKDLRNYLDNNRSPERSPERPTSRGNFMPYSRMASQENISLTPERTSTPTPAEKDMKETPVLRPTTRSPTKGLFGENTPPSATMLALQTMQVPDVPLNDITNGPTTPSGARIHTSYDFSSQLLNLTSIATNLQKEMTQLSRRSKDNATDLYTLKEATNSRDEDIRKTLRDLANTVTSTQTLLGPPPPISANRSTSNYSAPQFLDSKAFGSPPSASKTFGLPRAASAHSFLEERCGSPSPYSVEGAASVAMLEKIIREMVTKDGQERLLGTLSELLEQSREENSEATRKVEELSAFIREKSETQALVPVRSLDGGAPKLDINFDAPRARSSDATSSEELLKALQRIRDSIAHSGGTTSEVKGIVRDLRGEVLGMGRDLGKKLDQIGENTLNSTLDRSINDGKDSQHLEEVQRIVDEGMVELKQHLSSALKEKVQQDDASFRQLATTRSGPNGDEMLAVVQHALAEHHSAVEKREPEAENTGIDREGILDAVKDGLKDFEPNIELQQFGLERDEILAVLKEGLEDYQKNKSEQGPISIDKGEVYEVMQEALKDFQAPFPTEHLTQLKEEILGDVREALEGIKSSPAEPSLDHEAMQTTIFEAIKEGFANHGPSAPREIEISRDDLFDAVKSSLDGSAIPFGGFGEQVLSQLKELIDGMRVEFKQYSAANGRDTEQVLDAVKDGLESLRAEIESYVDRAQDVTGKDEIVDTVKFGLEQLRTDVQGYCSEGPQHDAGRAEMLEYIKAEFEQLHEAVTKNGSSREVEGANAGETTAVIIALKEGIDDLKAHLDGRDDMTSNEELNEAIKEEFEQLKGAILNANAADKSELIETIQDSMGALHSKFNGSDLTSISGGSTEDIVQTMREEFAVLKESIHAMVSEVDKDAVVTGVQHALDDLRTQLSGDHSDASAEALGAIKEELEQFKDTFATSLVVGSSSESTETLQAIQATLEEVKDVASRTSSGGMTDEQLEAFRGEFENLRTSIANSSVQGGSNEEVLDAVRLGLDDLRSHLERKLDNPESVMSHQSQVLDALNEGLENLRTDIVKTLDRPLDMTVNYEILDTLKDGLAGLRSEMDKLTSRNGTPVAPQSGEIVLAEGAAVGVARDISAEGDDDATPGAAATAATKHADLEKVEVLLAQLRIKIEAMDHTLQDMPSHLTPAQSAGGVEGSVTRDDLANLETMIRDVQENVITLAARGEATAPESAARKEDTDAIETLLRNTKSYLEDMTMPDVAILASKEHLEDVQTAVRMANDTLESLAEKIESNGATKADVAVVEVLASDIKTLMEELKDKQASGPDEDEEKPELMTKADLDILGVLCTEIKSRVNEMTLPDPDEMPSKADVEQLQGLINDFRESHDKLRESYETDIAVTAKAFDDRKQEHEDAVAQMGEVKTLLDELKSELLEKLGDSDSGLNALGETLKSIEDGASNESVITEVKEVMEKMKEEFERAHESLGAMKEDNAQYAETVFEKQSEHKAAVVTELGEKLDGLFDGLMSKYDDAQTAAEEKARVMEEKAAEQAELVNSTKTMADDLKLSIDTLGTTLTTFMGDLPATVEKMAEESKTVFNQVVENQSRFEEATEGFKGEHAATRDEVAKVLAAVDVVQSDMAEHNPRFMVTLEEVRALINQHYEHSQRASDVATEHTQAVRDLQDALKTGFETSRAQAQAHSDGLKSHHEELKTSLPALMPPQIEAPTTEKYDDSTVHEKLDKLMGHVEEAAGRSTQLERLDQIHEKVMATAAEVSAFVVSQNRQIAEDHDSKEKEAEEIALLLERRLERKDQLEADITVLNEEKESLANAVEALKAEKEALAAQKSRLNADVQSIETALHIRREELHIMDNKAAAIERRMLDGVMNQSRMLLLSKSTKPAPKKSMGRDLRVPSNASATSAHTVTSSVPPLKASHALAMRARPGMARNGAAPNTAERRIMSLNQINHNVPTGAHGFTSEKPSLLSSGLNTMKRSHSVRTNQYAGKPSWPVKRNISLSSSHNKENETLSEEDEDEIQSRPRTREGEEFGSEVGTERRMSYLSGTDGSITYATGSYLEGETPGTDDGHHRGYAPSDMTYDTGSYLTGSYLTGSEIDRRSSFGSSANGVVGGFGQSTIEESPEAEVGAERQSFEHGDVEEELRDELMQLEAPMSPHMRKNGLYAPPSDSGLGSDMPTGTMSGGEEYFK